MNKRMVGSVYEDIAVKYLEKQGFRIIERNFNCKMGEMDIIAIKDDILRFIEVKYRKNEVYGNAEEAVGYRKQKKCYQIAVFYLMKHPKFNDYSMSFDVLAITGNRINYLFNCYGGM